MWKTHSTSIFTVATKLKGETRYLHQHECPSDWTLWVQFNATESLQMWQTWDLLHSLDWPWQTINHQRQASGLWCCLRPAPECQWPWFVPRGFWSDMWCNGRVFIGSFWSAVSVSHFITRRFLISDFSATANGDGNLCLLLALLLVAFEDRTDYLRSWRCVVFVRFFFYYYFFF